MRATTPILLGVIALLSWRLWARHSASRFDSTTEHFRIEKFHTNESSGIRILDVNTGKPLWVKWDGKPGKESFYFRGEHVLDAWSTTNRPHAYGVFLHGEDESSTLWLNRNGASTFTERAHYDPQGELTLDEVWYDGNWYPMDRRNGRNGIRVNGEWRPLGFDTNGMWILRE